MKFLSLILLFIFLIFESSVTTIPIVFVVLLCLTVIYKESFVFLLAFIFGLILDVLSFRAPGVSSTFFIVFIFLVLIYQKKFEITTYPFVTISSFFGSFIFLIVKGVKNDLFLQSLVSTLFAVTFFYFLKRFVKLNKNPTDSI